MDAFGARAIAGMAAPATTLTYCGKAAQGQVIHFLKLAYLLKPWFMLPSPSTSPQHPRSQHANGNFYRGANQDSPVQIQT